MFIHTSMGSYIKMFYMNTITNIQKHNHRRMIFKLTPYVFKPKICSIYTHSHNCKHNTYTYYKKNPYTKKQHMRNIIHHTFSVLNSISCNLKIVTDNIRHTFTSKFLFSCSNQPPHCCKQQKFPSTFMPFSQSPWVITQCNLSLSLTILCFSKFSPLKPQKVTCVGR